MSSPPAAIIAVVCSGETVPEAKSGRCEAAAIVLSLNRTIASVFGLDPADEHLVPVCIQQCSPARASVVQFAILCRLADKRHLSWVVRYAQCVGVGGARTVYPPEHGSEPKLLYWDTLASSRCPFCWPRSVTVPVGCWRWKRAPQPQPPGMGFFDHKALAQHRYTCAERCGVRSALTGNASAIEVVAPSGAGDGAEGVGAEGGGAPAKLESDEAGAEAAEPAPRCLWSRYCLMVYLCSRYSLRVTAGAAPPCAWLGLGLGLRLGLGLGLG